MPKRPESVLVVVYSASGEVLLLRRIQPAGFWQSVTGSLEWDEIPWQAAVRELREETGLAPVGLQDCHTSSEFDILPEFLHRYAQGVTRNLEHVFSIRVSRRAQVTLDRREHGALCWLPREQAAALTPSWTNRDAILRFVPAGSERVGCDSA